MDAVILAGGRSSRLGQPKEDVVVDGRTLLDLTLAACAEADRIVVVGPERGLDGVVEVREDPVHGGPVAALAAALPHLDPEGDALVLACDMPRVAEVVGFLTAPERDAVLAVDRGRLQHLAGRYRTAALVDALELHPADNASMRSLVALIDVDLVEVPDGSTDDVDTPEDLAVLA